MEYEDEDDDRYMLQLKNKPELSANGTPLAPASTYTQHPIEPSRPKMEFNEDQKKAIDNITEWMNTEFNNDPVRILGGYAGTGKSTLIKYITAKFTGNYVITAPTNKAVKVIKEMNPYADCMTIYSLLGLKMEQDEDRLVLTKTESDQLTKLRPKLVIIDECGMINKELHSHIKSAIRWHGIKFLFVGDPGQLNPVGEDKSEIWGQYDVDVLRKVERHDNEILELATAIRSAKKLSDVTISNKNDGNEGVWSVEQEDFFDMLKTAAKAGDFVEKCKAIAWRNKTVDSLNKFIRHQIFGDVERWVVSDQLIFTSPYKVSDTDFIITDEEAVIEKISIGKNPTYGFKHYFVTVRDSLDCCHGIKLIHKDAEEQLADKLSDIGHQARNEKAYKRKRELWDEFWALKEYYANVKYAYALTAHRAQGSTFHTAFVDIGDILMNSNKIEAKRCLYVACTRPSARLILT